MWNGWRVTKHWVHIWPHACSCHSNHSRQQRRGTVWALLVTNITPGGTFLLCERTGCLFLGSYHMSASSLVEMVWKGKRAQSQTLCFSNLPVARAHSSCALQRHSGLVKFPAISSSLQHCIQSKHCHQAKWAVPRIPSFPCSPCSMYGKKEQSFPQGNPGMVKK